MTEAEATIAGVELGLDAETEIAGIELEIEVCNGDRTEPGVLVEEGI